MELEISPIPKAIVFQSICQKNGLHLSEEQRSKVSRFVEILIRWNQEINLISRKDEANVWESHILHSAAILFMKKIPERAEVLDIGTGGGLPGIVLKILRPDLSLTLLDSTNKKILAVRDMISKLHLRGIEAEWGRADERGTTQFKGRFDFVVARAVAALPELVVWTVPFLKKQKTIDSRIHKNLYLLPPALIALKGGEIESEIAKTKRHRYVREVVVEPLMFEGCEHLGGVDKKIVTVYF